MKTLKVGSIFYLFLRLNLNWIILHKTTGGMKQILSLSLLEQQSSKRAEMRYLKKTGIFMMILIVTLKYAKSTVG